MPQRQDTQGDFGLRPTKVTQGIVDSYHAPSIPKPDLSSLKALAGLSKTAAGLLQEHRKTEARHHEEGVAFGEVNPDAELQPEENISIFGVETPFKRGTTEAAMAGFQKGRGKALKDTFRASVTGEWATMLEEDERLKLQPEAFGAFLRQREAQFVQEHGIDGLALSSFGVGRDAWMLEGIHENNLASVKYQKEVFKTDMAEVTASNVAGLGDIAATAGGWSDEELMDRFMDDVVASGEPLMVEMPDGSSKAAFMLTATDLADPRVRWVAEAAAKRELVAAHVHPNIQGVLEEGHAIGGATELEVRAAVVKDLIASLASGKNPEETWMLLEQLTSGTGLLRDTNQFRAAYEADRERIEDNAAKRRRSYIDNMEIFIAGDRDYNNAEELQQGLKLAEDWRNAGLLTEEGYLALSQKMYGGFEANNDAEQKALELGTYDVLAFGDFGSEADPESFAPNGMSPEEAVAWFDDELGLKLSANEIRSGVARSISTNAAKLYPVDKIGRAQYEVELIMGNGLFVGAVPSSLTQRINLGASRGIRFTEGGLAAIEEGMHLFTASEGLHSGTRIHDRTARYYQYLQLRVNGGMYLEDAVREAGALPKDTWGSIPEVQAVMDDIVEFLPDDATPQRRRQLLKYTNILLFDGEGDIGDAIAEADDVMKTFNFGTLGSGDRERDFRRSPTNHTFNDRVQIYEAAILDYYQTEWRAEGQVIDDIVKRLTAKKTFQGVDMEVEAAIQTEAERSGDKVISKAVISGLKRDVLEKRYAAALVEYADQHEGIPAMRAQSAFRDADMHLPSARIGIVSTMDGILGYTVVNLDTRQPVRYHKGEPLKTRLSADDMVRTFDKESMDWEAARLETLRGLDESRFLSILAAPSYLRF
ncbi:MAG: hypothetical protein GY753_08595 [Gammaproteobacteria bacterium]|nr:hypothetical protein [Gammaproteobacteria bacterium]